MNRHSFHHPDFLSFFILSTVIFCLYSVSLGHNFLFDEEVIIIRNPAIQNIQQLSKLFDNGYFYVHDKVQLTYPNYFRPLTSLTFFIDYFLWKVNPLGYNLTNMFLHLAVMSLFFIFLKMIFRGHLVPLMVAALYAAHPIHTEAVTYIASRGDLMGAIGLLAAMIAYSRGWPVRTGLFFLLALFSKENSVLLPVYLFLIGLTLRGERPLQALRSAAPFFLMDAAYLLYRNYFCAVPLSVMEVRWGEGFLRVLSMGGPLLNYLQALILPESFKFLEAIPFAKQFNDPKVYVSLAVAGLILVGWGMAFRHRGRAFLGLSWFLVGILPQMQFILLHPEWAEHYLYFPAMGLCILLGLLVENALGLRRRFLTAALLAVYGIFFAFFCLRTEGRNQFYNDSIRYYEKLAESHSPYAYFGFEQLALASIREGDWEGAFVPLLNGLAIQPQSNTLHNLMGTYYLETNKSIEKGLEHYLDAYKYSGNIAPLYLPNIGIAYLRLEQYHKAIQTFESFRKQRPQHPVAYKNLIYAYMLNGQADKAVECGEAGLRALPVEDLRSQLYLHFAIIDADYQRGRDDLLRARLERLLKDHPKEFWYSDVARLLTARTGNAAFDALLATKYKEEAYQTSGRFYQLMAGVLSKDPRRVQRLLNKNRRLYENALKKNPHLAKDLERARRVLKSI